MSVHVSDAERLMAAAATRLAERDQQLRALRYEQEEAQREFIELVKMRDGAIVPLAPEYSAGLDEFLRAVGRVCGGAANIAVHLYEFTPESEGPFDCSLTSEWRNGLFYYRALIQTTNKDVMRRVRTAFQEICAGWEPYGGQYLKDLYATQWTTAGGNRVVYTGPPVPTVSAAAAAAVAALSEVALSEVALSEVALSEPAMVAEVATVSGEEEEEAEEEEEEEEEEAE